MIVREVRAGEGGDKMPQSALEILEKRQRDRIIEEWERQNLGNCPLAHRERCQYPQGGVVVACANCVTSKELIARSPIRLDAFAEEIDKKVADWCEAASMEITGTLLGEYDEAAFKYYAVLFRDWYENQISVDFVRSVLNSLLEHVVGDRPLDSLSDDEQRSIASITGVIETVRADPDFINGFINKLLVKMADDFKDSSPTKFSEALEPVDHKVVDKIAAKMDFSKTSILDIGCYGP